MTWRLWWPYANKIVQRQSSSRHGWFKRHRSRHRPPARGRRRVRCVHLLKFKGKGSPTRKRTQRTRSEEHTSELQSHLNLVCRLLLEKKKNKMSLSHISVPS